MITIRVASTDRGIYREQKHSYQDKSTERENYTFFRNSKSSHHKIGCIKKINVAILVFTKKRLTQQVNKGTIMTLT